ncbi:MAG TPA: hypothetical protein VND64_29835 [Pirellulales bacterium]|nr:hypothetical protein [Pirellulales bacterium]
MHCDEFEVRLNEVLDQRRQPEADVGLADHARLCGRCHALVTSFQAVLVGLERSLPIQCTDDLSDRVHAALAPAATLRFPRRRRLLALAASAAALLLVIGPWTWFGRGDRAAVPPLPITGPSATEQAGANSQPRPEKEIAGPYHTLARETTASLSVAMQLLPVESLGIGGAAGRQPRKASTTVPAEWVHGLTDGLTPVTRPTAGVMSTFIELISVKDEGKRS